MAQGGVTMGWYPLFLNLEGKRCLVVGGGKVATRKALPLIEKGGVVTVVAPRVSEILERLGKEGKITLWKRPFAWGDLEGQDIVFAATDDPALNAAIAEEAQKRNILVNVSSSKDQGDFITPACLETEDLLLALSTKGKNPVQSATLKAWLWETFSESKERIPRGNATCLSRALQLFPGGVNSPVRSFRAVGRYPIFIRYGKGSHVVDEDGKTYLDCIMSWGALILGHAHPRVAKALAEQVALGTSFGMNHAFEILLAEKIREHFPSIEALRMVNSGTEAVMSALRLARAATGRKKVLKFAGCYHGHVDALLVESGSGGLTFGIPSSLGVPEEYTHHTIVVPYNDLEATRKAFEDFGKELAAVIVEPVAGNMGVVLPHPEFLLLLRQYTERYGALLIFDEVITGFRVSLSGYQGLCGFRPDLTILGKIAGGGLPFGVYGGKRELMRLVAPEGGVYQAGTLSGNPLATRAGYTTITILEEDPAFYDALAEKTRMITQGLQEIAASFRLPLCVNAATGMLTPFFTSLPVVDTQTAFATDRGLYARFFQELLSRGVLVPPSPFEAWFLSEAHTPKDCERLLEAAEEAMRAMARDL